MGRSAWLRLWFAWAIPAALIVANGIWLLGIRGAVLGRGSLVQNHKASLESDVAMLSMQRDNLRGSRGSLDSLQRDMGALRKDQLGSMRERLVSFLVDVARRTQAAGMTPDRISYSALPDAKTGLVHFAATFSVDGTYEQIRRCVNLLESSPQFVVVERLALRQGDAAASLDVAVQLSVGTFFADADTGMLRELGIEDVPQVASSAAATPGQKAAAEPTPGERRTDFTSVDTQVMNDLRAAVAGLSKGEAAADEDVFVPPEQPRPAPSRRSDGSRIQPDRSGGSASFVGQIGRREVSGGR